MGDTFFPLILAAAVVALAVGYLVGRLTMLSRDLPTWLVIVLAFMVAFGPMAAILCGLLHTEVRLVHGLIWMIMFFTGAHLAEKKLTGQH